MKNSIRASFNVKVLNAEDSKYSDLFNHVFAYPVSSYNNEFGTLKPGELLEVSGEFIGLITDQNIQLTIDPQVLYTQLYFYNGESLSIEIENVSDDNIDYKLIVGNEQGV